MSPNSKADFEFLLFDGFSNMVLASAMEPLRDAKLRDLKRRANWIVSSLDGGTVTSSSGLQLIPNQKFDETNPARRLVLVAGYHARDLVNKQLIAKLRRAARATEMMMALDSAPWLLAAAGLLNGRNATIHWQELDGFEDTFPSVKISKDRFVESGPYLTCGGASTVFDMMLKVIKDLFGAAVALEASTMFVYDPERRYHAQDKSVRMQNKGSTLLLNSLDVMAENIQVPLTTIQIAERVLTSERTLNRKFTRELAVTPGRYYKLLRLRQARHLAQETELSLGQIALRCGFSSAPSLSRSYKDEFGVTVRQA